MKLGLLVPVIGAAGCSDFFLQNQEEPVVEPLRVEERWIQSALPEVDVLWVMDDTPSMSEEQDALADAADAFVGALDGADLAWQVGVVTTDLSAPDAGRLRGNPWVIVPGLSAPEIALAEAADVGATGGEPAGGLGAAALALREPLRSGANRGFRRPAAALHVVIFSDGEDESDDVLGGDPVAAFLAIAASERASSGRDVLVSAVVGDAGSGCVGDLGSAVPGERYLEVAAATGGASSSICAADLSPILAEVGAVSAEWPVAFALQAVPKADTARVWVDGQSLPDGWLVDFETLMLIFDQPPAPDAAIRMSYVVEAAAPSDTGRAQ